MKSQLKLAEDSLEHFQKLLGLESEDDFMQNMSYQIYLRRRDLILAEMDWCEDILNHKK
ncbi:hypothetical protein MCOL2_08041 [Listeria fleischmannii FSL S10-1203]|uniref:Transcriptional regulator n=1 Tax=Listeria fleischmannii FSL S10-1203 TaxID=1265822 RepID=W7DMR7_9LIST|nr:hypothetical protein MCOL2_08041 [Listeria fleischmannii FSL S10-1203]